MESVVRHEGPHAFLRRAEAWLRKAEDRHNLILGLAYGLASGSPGSDVYFGTVEDGADVVGCLLRTPPHKLLVTEMPLERVDEVVGSLAAAFDHVPAVLGPDEVAAAIAMRWVEVKGGGWRPGAQQRIYRLDEVRPPAEVAGALRPAAPSDAQFAAAWGQAFATDTGVSFANAPEAVRTWIANRQLFIWDDDGPRSIAVAHGRTPVGVRIGYVYTPPESRGKGYASACVAAVSQAMLERGIDFCTLYTDLSNPTSNAIYQRIGYYPIADVRDYDLFAEGVY